ncbi:MAG: metallophosphoesterase [Pseudomonadota bacterium]
MNVLIVADLHYSLHQFDWLLNAAADYDLVIIAGDLLDIAGHCDLDVQIVVMLKYLDRIRRRSQLMVCSGNHDGDARNGADELVAAWLQEAGEDGVQVDGESVFLGKDLFTLCPWWDGPVAQQDMVDLLAADALRVRDRWIWIHHAPPDRSAVSWTGRRHQGDQGLTKLIERFQPTMVVSGHIHNSPFRQGGSWVDRIGATWVFNPGRQLGGIPAYITLDLASSRAAWVSLAGQDSVDLTAPRLPAASAT